MVEEKSPTSRLSQNGPIRPLLLPQARLGGQNSRILTGYENEAN
jgi:hypothetical protein